MFSIKFKSCVNFGTPFSNKILRYISCFNMIIALLEYVYAHIHTQMHMFIRCLFKDMTLCNCSSIIRSNNTHRSEPLIALGVHCGNIICRRLELKIILQHFMSFLLAGKISFSLAHAVRTFAPMRSCINLERQFARFGLLGSRHIAAIHSYDSLEIFISYFTASLFLFFRSQAAVIWLLSR